MLLYFRKKAVTQIIENLFSDFDKHFDKVSLLIKADTNFSDYSLRSLAVTNFNSTTINTSNKKFGNGSASFTGSSNLNVPNGNQFVFGTGDFTIEFWINGSSSQTNKILLDFRAAGSNNHMHITTGGHDVSTPGGIRYVSNSGSPAAGLYTTTSIMNDLWHHIAVVRYAGTTSIFVDGVKSAFAADTFNFTGTAGNVFIGYNSYGGGPNFTGLLDDIRITKGVARYTSNFTVSSSEHPMRGYELDFDPYWNQTVLSLHGNLTDATGKNTITAGAVTTSTSVVKTGTNSMYFGGNSWLHIPASTNFEFGASDFTIETWWYPTTLSSRQWLFHANTDYWLGLDYQPGSPGLGMWMSSTGTSWNIIHSDSGGGGISNRHLVVNAWNHVAMTRSGTTFSLFLNGELIKTVTGITAAVVNRASEIKVIGSWAATHANPIYNHQLPISGYLDDFRVTKGVARYVTNFIPKISTPLSDVGPSYDPFWNNVSVLLDSTTPLTDASSHGRTLSFFGFPQSSNDSPYAGTNSILFNGTSDYLTIPAAANITTETEWTIEGVVKFGSGAIGQQLWSGYATTQNNWALYTNASNTLSIYLSSNGSSWNIASGVNVITGINTSTWYHIAIVKTASQYVVYVNGTAAATIVNSTNIFNNGNVVSIGGMQGGYSTNCRITDFRITKGVARYTSNFSTPTVQHKTAGYSYTSGTEYDPYWNNVVFASYFDGDNGSTSFIDQKGKTITKNGNAVISTGGKFGTNCLYVNGTSTTSLTIPASIDFAFDNKDFTIEMWFKPVTSSFGRIIYEYNTSTNGAIFGIYINGTTITSAISADNLDDSNPSKVMHSASQSGLTIGDWNHIVFERYNNTLRCYVNGVGGAITNTNITMTPITYPVYIGARNHVGSIIEQINAYMDDIRITKGVARYTKDFTPPASPMLSIGSSS